MLNRKATRIKNYELEIKKQHLELIKNAAKI